MVYDDLFSAKETACVHKCIEVSCNVQQSYFPSSLYTTEITWKRRVTKEGIFLRDQNMHVAIWVTHTVHKSCKEQENFSHQKNKEAKMLGLILTSELRAHATAMHYTNN